MLATIGMVLLVGACASGTLTAPEDPGPQLQPPAAPDLTMTVESAKLFVFTWSLVEGATQYVLLEDVGDGGGLTTLGSFPANHTHHAHEVYLPGSATASYVLRACNSVGCGESEPFAVAGTLVDAIGYFTPPHPDTGAGFGSGVALSADGAVVAVGANRDNSSSAGIDGDPFDDGAPRSGAVFVLTRVEPGSWVHQAYLKASLPASNANFGSAVAVSGDGRTIAVGAPGQSSAALGVDGDEDDESATASGAVYVFAWDDTTSTWSQQAFIKASNTRQYASFGASVALDHSGALLVVGSPGESSAATGVDGDQDDTSAARSGAGYVFVRDAESGWHQVAYLKSIETAGDYDFGHDVAVSADSRTIAVGSPKLGRAVLTGVGTAAPHPESGSVEVFVRSATGAWSFQALLRPVVSSMWDAFGVAVSLSGEGGVLVVGASAENGGGRGVDPDPTDFTAIWSGAAYVFERDTIGTWSQGAYLKPSNTDPEFWFGTSVGVSSDGNSLAVGARREHGGATGLNGSQDAAWQEYSGSGAVYEFARDGGGTWYQRAYVKSSNTAASQSFGQRLAVAGDGRTLVVAPFIGAVYLY